MQLHYFDTLQAGFTLQEERKLHLQLDMNWVEGHQRCDITPPLLSHELVGQIGTGKTATAVTLAMSSGLKRRHQNRISSKPFLHSSHDFCSQTLIVVLCVQTQPQRNRSPVSCILQELSCLFTIFSYLSVEEKIGEHLFWLS